MFKVINIATGRVEFASQDERAARKWKRRFGDVRFAKILGPSGYVRG